MFDSLGFVVDCSYVLLRVGHGLLTLGCEFQLCPPYGLGLLAVAQTWLSIADVHCLGLGPFGLLRIGRGLLKLSSKFELCTA